MKYAQTKTCIYMYIKINKQKPTTVRVIKKKKEKFSINPMVEKMALISLFWVLNLLFLPN